MLFENLTNEEIAKARAEIQIFKDCAIDCAFMVKVDTLRERRGGCTNGGETDNIDSFYLFSDKMSRAAVVVYAHDAGFPENKILHLKRRVIFGSEYIHADVITRPGSWHMAGGNFVYTCDGRYEEITGGLAYPVQVHDRVEA